ncbi:MAG: CAP domain-containing protein [Verrucomicrobia bacterium]|nr:MAG: CAP domain-containing protein [Verrucomicrobiota bacterium]RPF91600.1 MAG: CAP domain-containing protein [Roseibacillus sp. TMED18]
MRRFLLLLLPLLPGVSGVMAAPRATDEILSALQTRLERNIGFEDLIEQLSDLEPKELKRLQSDYDKVWPGLRDTYLDSFRKEAEDQHSGAARQSNQRAIKEARERFHSVRMMAEGPMKGAIIAQSEPAVALLRELLLPSGEKILQVAGENLNKQRAQIIKLGAFRDGILKAAIAIEDAESVANILAQEQSVAEGLSDLERNGLRVMKANRKIAEAEMVPEAERRGVEELNQMRLLIGLNALVLDPKLCEASRGHSEDMATLNFFSHTSPVKGKESFGQRAALCGASSSGENIFMGSTKPSSANRGWFRSPGHHKNMFSPGHRRVGLGNYGSHWTQMFGR